jgi:hypothetical protein
MTITDSHSLMDIRSLGVRAAYRTERPGDVRLYRPSRLHRVERHPVQRRSYIHIRTFIIVHRIFERPREINQAVRRDRCVCDEVVGRWPQVGTPPRLEVLNERRKVEVCTWADPPTLREVQTLLKP